MKHNTSTPSLFRCIIICIGIVFAVNSVLYALYPLKYVDYTKSNLLKVSFLNQLLSKRNTDINIIQITEEWRILFFSVFIINELSPMLVNSTNSIYKNDINTLIAKNKNDLHYDYNNLLDITFTFFTSSINHTTDPFVTKYHRNIISIRRYIMILHQYLSTTNNTYYKLINNVFINIHNNTITHSYQKKNNKSFYLIHLSKSAGTSICFTLKLLFKFKTTEFCNMPGTNTPIKEPDIGVRSCSEIHQIQTNNSYEFLAQETPLTGHNINNIPTLCDNYNYILPIRNPITRIASLLSEWNMLHYWPLQLLVNPNAINTTNSLKAPYCPHGIININNTKYQSITMTEHWTHFITHLFNKKQSMNNGEIINFANNFKCGSGISYLDDKYQRLYQRNHKTYIYWLDDHKTHGIKITEGFRHRINPNLFRGYASNVLTRWIGYKYQKINTTTVYDSIFDSSDNINIFHWLNAINLMMKTDYILPLDRNIDHNIWNIFLNDVAKHSKENVMSTHWRHEQISNNKMGRIPTAQVIKSWSEKDYKILYNNNLLDMQLYKLSIWIADADVAFNSKMRLNKVI